MLSEGPEIHCQTTPYVSPDRQLLQELAQAPKGIQPTLMSISSNEGTTVSVADGRLCLTLSFHDLQEAIWQAQKTNRRDLTIAVTILACVMVITAALVILLRG